MLGSLWAYGYKGYWRRAGIAFLMLAGVVFHKMPLIGVSGALSLAASGMIALQCLCFKKYTIVMRGAHLAFVCIATGIACTPLSQELALSMRLHETKVLEPIGVTLYLNTIEDYQTAQYKAVKAEFQLTIGAGEGAKTLTLYPEKRFYLPRKMPTTESAIFTSGLSDWYIALGDPLGDDGFTVRLVHRPYVRLIWAGGLMLFLITLYSSFAQYRRDKKPMRHPK